MNTIRKTALALVVLTGLLGTIASPALASPPKLAPMLLSINQMPTGWSVTSASSGHVGCYGNALALKTIKQTATAVVEFQGSSGLPDVGEALATYTNAKAAYSKIVANLAACKHFSGTANGNKVTGTMGQMSFPRYGNASEAFAVNLTTQGVSSGLEDKLIVRQGSVIMLIQEGNLASVNLRQFKGFVKLAVAKVR